MTACAPLLQRYDWPGNVRELRNLTERLALFLAAEPLQALTPAFVLSVAPELAATPTTPASAWIPPARRLSAPAERVSDVLAASAADATPPPTISASAAPPSGASSRPRADLHLASNACRRQAHGGAGMASDGDQGDGQC
jgi:propionate catabolism operon transcriptional regulator